MDRACRDGGGVVIGIVMNAPTQYIRATLGGIVDREDGRDGIGLDEKMSQTNEGLFSDEPFGCLVREGLFC